MPDMWRCSTLGSITSHTSPTPEHDMLLNVAELELMSLKGLPLKVLFGAGQP